MENYLPHLTSIVGYDRLSNMRKSSDLHPYLPFEAGGLTVRLDKTKKGVTARGRQGAFLILANTPATQIMTRNFLPEDIVRLAEETIPRDYDPELIEWEGPFSDALKPRGGRNFFHLLEQAIAMGPTGDEYKKGEAPMDWDLFYQAVDDVIHRLKESIEWPLKPKHLLISTPSSSSRGLSMAHVLKNSAGEPYFSDDRVERTAKKYHVYDSIDRAAAFMLPENQSLPMWPFVAFARGDRAAEYELYMDSEMSRKQAVFSKRDRKIDAQSFVIQELDGMWTQALADAISVSSVPEIDMREPSRLSNHFETGYATVQDHGEDAFSIGRDESAWDQHFTPQMWYGVFLIYRALFAPTAEVVIVKSDRALLVEEHEIDRFDSLAVGATITAPFRYVAEGGAEYVEEYEVTKVLLDTNTQLRRVFASVSGTNARFGDILVEGYKVVLETPRDGKFLTGWSMRSGNFCTFLANSLANWIKSRWIHHASKDLTVRKRFESIYGYQPPAMDLVWFVCRGDDAGDVWVVKNRRKGVDWKISELISDWLSLTGAKANAKKQDTSDVRGRWRLSFAQLFTSENFIRGTSSIVRVLERNIWNENDEVVAYDPDTGEDLRSVLKVMNTYGRVNNLWGVWDRVEHPRAAELTNMLQDLDAERLLPPLDEEERLKAARAWALKMMRRGQISASQLDDAVRHFWTTDLPQHALSRYDKMDRLHDRKWAPITRYDEDTRPIWRSKES